MKSTALLLALLQVSFVAVADTIPIITTQPQSQTLVGSASATLSVVSSNATGYQWRYNGFDLSGATNSTLQATNQGYYLALVRNATGWVPSRMAYIAVSLPDSFPPMPSALLKYSTTNTILFGLGGGGGQITSGSAQFVAGPELDQMQPVGSPIAISGGHFVSNGTLAVPTAPPSTAYYSAYITATSPFSGITPSTVSTAASSPFTNSFGYLKFPAFAEYPEPIVVPALNIGQPPQQTNLIQIPGENVTLSLCCICYNEYGLPKVQWRKDGRPIPGATNVSYYTTIVGDIQNSFTSAYTVMDIQGTNAGVYDTEIFGDNWLPGPKITLSIQFTNGPGVFKSPRLNGTNFVSDLVGAPTRNYTVQWSTNLSSWNDLVTLSNTTGTVTFTNAVVSYSTYFYRTKLLP